MVSSVEKCEIIKYGSVVNSLPGKICLLKYPLPAQSPQSAYWKALLPAAPRVLFSHGRARSQEVSISKNRQVCRSKYGRFTNLE